MTVYAGLARSFSQLFLARMGVGFGEAALTPTAYAMIADLFPANRMALAMSVFALGGSAIGVGMSLLLGGYVIGLVGEMGPFSLPVIGQVRAWQIVLIVVGLASLLMVVPLALLSEPQRQAANARERNEKRLFSACSARACTLQGGFMAAIFWPCALPRVSSYGTAAWIPTYFIRVHGWEASSAGMTLGIAYIVPALVGGLLAGWLSDRLFGSGLREAPLLIMASSTAVAAPVIVLFICIPMMELKWIFLVLLYLLSAVWAVLFPTVIQLATPSYIRAQVSAIHLLFINLVGIGFGPTAIALTTDFFFQNEMAVGSSIAMVGGGAYALSSIFLYLAIRPFKRQCESIMISEADPVER